MPVGAILGGIGTGLSALFNLGESQANREAQERANDTNLNFQKDVLAYNKSLQDRMFEREDNAISRRVADLRQSGLSPTLAAGQGAGAGSAIKVEAPKVNAVSHTFGSAINNAVSAGQGVLSLIGQKENISRTREETKLIEFQKERMKADTMLSAVKKSQALNDIEKTKIERDMLAHELKIFKDSGSTKYTGGWAKEIRDALMMLKESSLTKPLLDKVGEVYDKAHTSLQGDKKTVEKNIDAGKIYNRSTRKWQ